MKRWLSARGMGIGCLLIGGLLLFGTPDAWAAQADPMDKDLTQKKKDLKE